MLSVCDATSLLFLRVAACLGTKFYLKLVTHIIRSTYGFGMDANVLDLLVENGLLEHDLNGWVKFSHDRFQEAASSILGSNSSTNITTLEDRNCIGSGNGIRLLPAK